MNVGTADVNYVIRGIEGWIELKAVLLPKRDSTPVLGDDKGLNKDQINWHLARAQVLGRTWVFISTESYRWLVAGHMAREVNGMTRDELCMRARFWYDDKWGDVQWRTLLRILTY